MHNGNPGVVYWGPHKKAPSPLSQYIAAAAPLLKNLHIQSTLAIYLSLKSASDRQRHGTTQGHRSSEVF
jgi:hypothetical protein